MCGIVGYIGKKRVIPILLSGLSKLEYRGYDSAGIAIYEDNSINVYKSSGKLINLDNLLGEKKETCTSTLGIGHMRWATHGSPTKENAHPHSCNCGKISIVHNGIIENFNELKQSLIQKGVEFKSQTDTETIAHLVAYKLQEHKDLKKAVIEAIKELKGAYAIGVISKDNPDMIVAARKNAPLVIGLGEEENFIASDVPAILEYTKKVIYLDDNQITVVRADNVEIWDNKGNLIVPKVETIPWEPTNLSKMGYKHFMLKEIHEQPDVIRQTLIEKLSSAEGEIKFDEVKLNKENVTALNRIQIIACGTSLHAAMAGKYAIEELTGIPVDIEASSEYIYKTVTADKNSLVIGVSQSGETADTITAVRQAKANGAHILIITNRPDSTMARDADSLVSINAGIEISVAATKSYTAQLLAFYLLAIYIAEIKQTVSKETISELKHELLMLPQRIEMVLSNKEEIRQEAIKYANFKDFIFIARGVNLSSCLEGALKLKEISYINATGYPAGELKHGPIAMLDETMPVLAILTLGKVYEKILSNCEEAKARSARMITVTSSNEKDLENIFETIIKVPYCAEIISPLLMAVPLQLWSYYIAEFLGKDVDQPRNLAKSVTVE